MKTNSLVEAKHTFIPLNAFSRRHFRYSSEATIFYQHVKAMRNTADVTDSKPIAVWSQYISGVSAVNPFVAFYDVHKWKGEVLFFCSVLDTTRTKRYYNLFSVYKKRNVCLPHDFGQGLFQYATILIHFVLSTFIKLIIHDRQF
jgi:hypothetical protein